MNSRFRFSFEPDWMAAPLAYWVHVPIQNSTTEFEPPAPKRIPHKGFCILRVELGEEELVFSSAAQLNHFVEVFATKPLPSSRQLSSRRGISTGLKEHWLSRLPTELKSPSNRVIVVRHLRAVQVMLFGKPGRGKRKPLPPTVPWLGNTPEA